MSTILDEMHLPITYGFKCLHCGETFNIHFNEILKSNYISCPNCKCVMVDEAAANLQLAIKSLDRALTCLKNNNSYHSGIFSPEEENNSPEEENKGFRIVIKWPESKLLPDDSEDDCNFKPPIRI